MYQKTIQEVYALVLESEILRFYLNVLRLNLLTKLSCIFFHPFIKHCHFWLQNIKLQNANFKPMRDTMMAFTYHDCS